MQICRWARDNVVTVTVSGKNQISIVMSLLFAGNDDVIDGNELVITVQKKKKRNYKIDTIRA